MEGPRPPRVVRLTARHLSGAAAQPGALCAFLSGLCAELVAPTPPTRRAMGVLHDMIGVVLERLITGAAGSAAAGLRTSLEVVDVMAAIDAVARGELHALVAHAAGAAAASPPPASGSPSTGSAFPSVWLERTVRVHVGATGRTPSGCFAFGPPSPRALAHVAPSAVAALAGALEQVASELVEAAGAAAADSGAEWITPAVISRAVTSDSELRQLLLFDGCDAVIVGAGSVLYDEPERPSQPVPSAAPDSAVELLEREEDAILELQDLLSRDVRTSRGWGGRSAGRAIRPLGSVAVTVPPIAVPGPPSSSAAPANDGYFIAVAKLRHAPCHLWLEADAGGDSPSLVTSWPAAHCTRLALSLRRVVLLGRAFPYGSTRSEVALRAPLEVLALPLAPDPPAESRYGHDSSGETVFGLLNFLLLSKEGGNDNAVDEDDVAAATPPRATGASDGSAATTGASDGGAAASDGRAAATGSHGVGPGEGGTAPQVTRSASSLPSAQLRPTSRGAASAVSIRDWAVEGDSAMAANGGGIAATYLAAVAALDLAAANLVRYQALVDAWPLLDLDGEEEHVDSGSDCGGGSSDGGGESGTGALLPLLRPSTHRVCLPPVLYAEWRTAVLDAERVLARGAARAGTAAWDLRGAPGVFGRAGGGDSTAHIIPATAIERLIREIAAEFKTDLRFTSDALEVLHMAAEEHLVSAMPLIAADCEAAAAAATGADAEAAAAAAAAASSVGTPAADESANASPASRGRQKAVPRRLVPLFQRRLPPPVESLLHTSAARSLATQKSGLQVPVPWVNRRMRAAVGAGALGAGRDLHLLGSPRRGSPTLLSGGAPIYLAAVVEYVMAELLELAGGAATGRGDSIVLAGDVLCGLDEELFCSITNLPTGQAVLRRHAAALLQPQLDVHGYLNAAAAEARAAASAFGDTASFKPTTAPISDGQRGDVGAEEAPAFAVFRMEAEPVVVALEELMAEGVGDGPRSAALPHLRAALGLVGDYTSAVRMYQAAAIADDNPPLAAEATWRLAVGGEAAGILLDSAPAAAWYSQHDRDIARLRRRIVLPASLLSYYRTAMAACEAEADARQLYRLTLGAAPAVAAAALSLGDAAAAAVYPLSVALAVSPSIVSPLPFPSVMPSRSHFSYEAQGRRFREYSACVARGSVAELATMLADELPQR